MHVEESRLASSSTALAKFLIFSGPNAHWGVLTSRCKRAILYQTARVIRRKRNVLLRTQIRGNPFMTTARTAYLRRTQELPRLLTRLNSHTRMRASSPRSDTADRRRRLKHGFPAALIRHRSIERADGPEGPLARRVALAVPRSLRHWVRLTSSEPSADLKPDRHCLLQSSAPCGLSSLNRHAGA